MPNSPILVTGSHRSGSTWVGRMLCLSKDTGFIWEPLSVETSKGVFRGSIDEWFIFINELNSNDYITPLSDTLAFKYSYLAELGKIRGPRRLARLVRDGYRFHMCQKQHLRPVMKDPIALMSAEWLFEKFSMDMVVLIRNPFAFCASLIKLKFNHPFSHFLSQPDLMSSYLSDFEGEITDFSKNKKSILEQGVLLWNIIHHVIAQYQDKYPQWGYYRHEDLSTNPIAEYEKMYSQVQLEFTEEIRDKINISCGVISNSNKQNGKHVRSTSITNLNRWKKYLSKSDTDYVRAGTKVYLERFYPDIETIL